MDNSKQLILATGNSGKIMELCSLLPSMNCIPQSDLGIQDIPETGLSFVENAILKARHATRIGKLPALADDSGLVVEALNGKPGIFSARFAGKNATNQENINLLLESMKFIPIDKRQAYFYCVIVLLQHPDDPTPIIATGQWHGEISLIPSGNQGFGYDPVFFLPELNCTAAELSSDQKNSLSHRAQALKKLKTGLKLFQYDMS